jgi:stage III sporulation protein AA
VGKTTALRSLASYVGGGKNPLHVCVVDERCEFDEWDYRDKQVDILRGYKKREGIEIATRTLSPDLIMIDEIGADDATAILSVISCGVPIIATAHAASREELVRKPSLSRLFEVRAFDTLVGIGRSGRKYLLTEDKL